MRQRAKLTVIARPCPVCSALADASKQPAPLTAFAVGLVIGHLTECTDWCEAHYEFARDAAEAWAPGQWQAHLSDDLPKGAS